MNKKLRIMAHLSILCLVGAFATFLIIFAKAQEYGVAAKIGISVLYAYAWYVGFCYVGWRKRCLCLLKGGNPAFSSNELIAYIVGWPLINGIYLTCVCHFPLERIHFSHLWLASVILLAASFLAMKPVENAAIRTKKEG